MGCSVHVNGRRSFGDWDGSTAIVRLNEDGRATVITGEGEIGQGNLTVLRQIAAEELGLPYEHVDITRPDTDLHSHSLGALASRLTYVAAMRSRTQPLPPQAVARGRRRAVQAARDRADDHQRRNRPANGAESEFRPVGAVVRANIYQPGGQPIVGVGNFDNPSEFPDHNRYGNESGAYNFIAQAAEVEVDRATGEVKLLEIASAVDCGTVINPATAIGQVQGGVMQGVGLALTEYFDWWNGQPDRPATEGLPHSRRRAGAEAPYRVRGIVRAVGTVRRQGAGRDRLDAIPAVIANAVADAVGVRIHELPITSEKIHRALHPELYAGEKTAPPPRPKAPRGRGSPRADRPAHGLPRRTEFVHAASVEEAVRLLAGATRRWSAAACRTRCVASAPAFRRRSGSSRSRASRS
jgi:CO/xanthine dehydrogenase Mo-binding subunit